jgi:hypothetical protein
VKRSSKGNFRLKNEVIGLGNGLFAIQNCIFVYKNTTIFLKINHLEKLPILLI